MSILREEIVPLKSTVTLECPSWLTVWHQLIWTLQQACPSSAINKISRFLRDKVWLCSRSLISVTRQTPVGWLCPHFRAVLIAQTTRRGITNSLLHRDKAQRCLPRANAPDLSSSLSLKIQRPVSIGTEFSVTQTTPAPSITYKCCATV